MANSLKAKISKLRHDRNITEEEYQEIISKLDGHDKQIKAEEREHIINVIEEIKQRTFYCMGDLCDDTTLEGYHCANCALDYIIERLKEVKDYA